MRSSENIVESLCDWNPDQEILVRCYYWQRIMRIGRAIIDSPAAVPALRSHAQKIRGFFARLLLVYHITEWRNSMRWMCEKEPDLNLDSGETAARAFELMKRFLIPRQSA